MEWIIIFLFPSITLYYLKEEHEKVDEFPLHQKMEYNGGFSRFKLLLFVRKDNGCVSIFSKPQLQSIYEFHVTSSP